MADTVQEFFDKLPQRDASATAGMSISLAASLALAIHLSLRAHVSETTPAEAARPARPGPRVEQI